MQNTTTLLPDDTTRPKSCRKPLVSSLVRTPKLSLGTRQSSTRHMMSVTEPADVVNIYDRQMLKESRDMMTKIDQMRNRLSYIDREGEKNVAQMKIKQQKLSYIKDYKEKASEWCDTLNEAKTKQEKEKQDLKRKVSTVANKTVESIIRSKQRIFDTKANNARQMKIDKDAAKQRLAELERKDLEEKQLKAKRVSSSKRSSFLFSGQTSTTGSQRTLPAKLYKPVVKLRTEKENDGTLESMQRELQQLINAEQHKLEKLQNILRDKKEVDDNYAEVLHLRNVDTTNE